MSFHDYDRPKKGRVFKVIGVGRISTDNQDERSLDDQESLYREHLERLYKAAKFDVTVIATRGSGQILDREEYLQLCDMVEGGEYDIVIAEDLGRIVRRMQGYIFCEEAEDVHTRVIAINDFIDTADDGWRQATIFASFKHESFCRETSQRIRRTHRARFQKGGIFQYEIYGYIKPGKGVNDAEVTKDPLAEDVYDQWFAMLENGFNYREVADWLNALGVPTGRFCKSKTWNGTMVGRITFDPILKGVRRRNERVTIRVNKQDQKSSPVLPSLDEIRTVADEAFTDLAVDSKEFSRIMHDLVDEFFVLPYRLADGGEVQPRIVFRASMGKLLSPKNDLQIMQFDRLIDLAKRPRRLRYLNDVVGMVSEGMKHADIGQQLGIFKSEVGYAMRLYRCMIAQSTIDPWVPVTSADQVYDCYKRVRNPRFKFEPLEGFEATRHPER